MPQDVRLPGTRSWTRILSSDTSVGLWRDYHRGTHYIASLIDEDSGDSGPQRRHWRTTMDGNKTRSTVRGVWWRRLRQAHMGALGRASVIDTISECIQFTAYIIPPIISYWGARRVWRKKRMFWNSSTITWLPAHAHRPLAETRKRLI